MSFLVGSTQSDLGGQFAGVQDAFLAKYDDEGNQIWLHQYGGPAYDAADSIRTDGQGNIYVQERLNGFFDSSNRISKYDNDGNPLWSRELGGTDGGDVFWGMSADGQGNVYMNGSTRRGLDGPNAGLLDAFVRKYSADGDLRWTVQFGSSEHDHAFANAVDQYGNVVFVGSTEGSLAGPFAGGSDAWIAQLHDPVSVPEPKSIALLGAAAAFVSLIAGRRYYHA